MAAKKTFLTSLFFMLFSIAPYVHAGDESYPNYGEWWLSLTEPQQVAWVSGFSSGGSHFYIKTLHTAHKEGFLTEEEVNSINIQDFHVGAITRIGEQTIAREMTSLYQSTTNPLIDTSFMLKTAVRRLEGRSVDMEQERREAIRRQDQLRNLQN